MQESHRASTREAEVVPDECMSRIVRIEEERFSGWQQIVPLQEIADPERSGLREAATNHADGRLDRVASIHTLFVPCGTLSCN